MEDRIPSSLKWLVNKRSRIHGEILKAENEAKKWLEQHERGINKLQNDLQAIDHTLGLHEIFINPDDIQPIRSHRNKRKLKYGTVTKLIYEYLGNASNHKPTTTEITIFIANESNLELSDHSDFLDFRHVVRKRLKALRQKGKINSAEFKHNNDERKWYLL